MIIVLLLVLAGVGFVYAARYRRAHVMATGSVRVGDHQRPAMSPVGRWSLIVLASALLVWSLTFATLPIYYAAVLAGLLGYRLIAKARHVPRASTVPAKP